jgi:hypothetical protein
MRPILTLLAAAALLAAGPLSPPMAVDPMTLDDQTFERELKTRFQYDPPQPEPHEIADPAAGQAADADYFAAFPDYDRAYTPAARAQAKHLAQVLRHDAARLSHEQFVLRVAEIAALADNGHTAIGENAFKKNTPRLPLRTYLFADGLYVLRAAPDLSSLLGARIDTIDGRKIDDIFAQLRRYMGGSEIHRRLQLLPMLESPALLQAAGLATTRDALTLRGVTLDGRTFEQRVTAVARDRSAPVSSTARLLFPIEPGKQLENFVGLAVRGDMPVYLHQPLKLFALDPLANDGLYVALGFNKDGDEEKIAPFLAGVLDHVARDKPRFVVVDLRMNGGGDNTTTYAFAHALPNALAADAHLYVLTSGWTFSAAITTAAALKQAGGAKTIIVGEPVGDRLAFWAEGGRFALPNAFLAVNYAAGLHDYSKPCADWSSCFWLNYRNPVAVDTLEPAIRAPLTFAAYAAGRDPALEAVQAHEAQTRIH